MTLINLLNLRLHEREQQGLRRERHIAESACAPRQWTGPPGRPPRDLLTFCSNDYLGLANHPALVQALAEGARHFGAGSGGSHLIGGHSAAHAGLESDLATWFRPHIPDVRTLEFCTGYMANLALLTALGSADATLFSDDLNHASLIDGARLAKAQVQRYPHSGLNTLSEKLAVCTTPIKLIVTDAVFSMDGNLADLPSLLALAEQFDAWLIVDDAHGFGVLGPGGRGSAAHFDLCSERLIYMGTLGKAAGLSGAFVAAHPAVIDWLIQSARSYIYTTASSPALAHALRQSLRLIEGHEGDARRADLRQLMDLLRSELSAVIHAHPRLNWQLTTSHTAIQPLIVGDNVTALALSRALDLQGLRVPAIRPPTVPIGTARLRITLSAAHTVHDVTRLVEGLSYAAEQMEGRR